MGGLDIVIRGGASHAVSLRLNANPKGRDCSTIDLVDASLQNQVLWGLLRRKSISALSLWVTDFDTLSKERNFFADCWRLSVSLLCKLTIFSGVCNVVLFSIFATDKV